MLPTKYRLQKSTDFQKVFKNSRPIRLLNLTFRAFKNPRLASDGETRIRFGFIISNKIDKRATRRNALKRQLRQVASDLISELKTGYDIVTVVHKDFPFPYEQDEIKKQFREGIKRLGLLN
ncbi:MAG: ribonuclease P protein component [Patescibacteria group bacterium]|nr:ribonuclease P protein component [Patescibacteria group bacterium]